MFNISHHHRNNPPSLSWQWWATPPRSGPISGTWVEMEWKHVRKRPFTCSMRFLSVVSRLLLQISHWLNQALMLETLSLLSSLIQLIFINPVHENRLMPFRFLSLWSLRSLTVYIYSQAADFQLNCRYGVCRHIAAWNLIIFFPTTGSMLRPCPRVSRFLWSESDSCSHL